jgi:hypothetical protein
VVITVHARFVAFLERMGGSEALQGLEHVPLSSLPAAVSFIQGHGAPSRRGYARKEQVITGRDRNPTSWSKNKSSRRTLH